MSETTEAPFQRTLEEINRDYHTACARLGEAYHQAAAHEKLVSNLHRIIDQLQTEARALPKAPVEG